MNTETPTSGTFTQKVKEFFLPEQHRVLDIASQNGIRVSEMASEELIKNLLKEMEEMKMEYKKTIEVLSKGVSPTAPSYSLFKDDDIVDESREINENDLVSVERHRFIRELLCEIREFDGTSDVEAFLTQIRNAKFQLSTSAEKCSLVRKIVAIKLKGEAQRVAERNRVDNLKSLGEALRTAFGKLEVEYEQLAEERNSMRQGINESVDSYIRRYEEIDKRIQLSLDSIENEFREATRRIENRQNVEKFIRGLRKEIRVEVKLAAPKNLRTAFLTAQKEEKYFKDDEILRRRQEYRSAATSIPARGRGPAPSTPARDSPRFSATVVTEREGKQAPPSSDRARLKSDEYCNYCRRSGHTDDKCYRKHPELRRNFQLRPSSTKDPTKRINFEGQQEQEGEQLLSHEEEALLASKEDQPEWLASMKTIGRSGLN